MHAMSPSVGRRASGVAGVAFLHEAPAVDAALRVDVANHETHPEIFFIDGKGLRRPFHPDEHVIVADTLSGGQEHQKKY